MARGRGRGGLSDHQTVCAACGVFVVAFVSLILFIASFGYVDELEYCLRYNTVTRVVEDVVEPEAGTYFVGVDGSFICFPRTRQRMSWTGAEGTRLTTRTAEGLALQLDITVEYKLQKDNVKKLFNLFLEDYGPFLHSAAVAEVLNTASTFPAGDFLSIARQNISTTMLNNLNVRLNPFYFDVIDVQLRHVDLVDAFEEKIETLEGQRLAQQAALAQREVDVQNEHNDRIEKVIDLSAQREQILIDAEALVDKATLKREAELTQANITRQTQALLAGRTRQDALIEIDGKLAVAEAKRQAALTGRRTIAEDLRYQRAQLVEQAHTNAYKKLAQANITAVDTVEQAKAEAEAILAERQAQRQVYKDLLTTGMTKEDVLRYAWMNTLKSFDGTKFFVDYKKVPLFVESAAGNPELQDLIKGLGLSQT